MNRIVLVILIVLNAGVAVFGLLGVGEHRRADGDAEREPVGAEQIRIVRGEPEPVPPPPAAPPPVPEAPNGSPAQPAAAAACLEFGPFSQEELARVQQALVPLRAEGRLTAAPIVAMAGWWVYVPPRKTRELAEREVARLNALGVMETYVVQESSDMRFAISLGIFRTIEAAQRFAERLREKGVTSAVIGARQHQIRMTALYLRDPVDAETQRILEVKSAFPATEVRATACPGPQ